MAGYAEAAHALLERRRDVAQEILEFPVVQLTLSQRILRSENSATHAQVQISRKYLQRQHEENGFNGFARMKSIKEDQRNHRVSVADPFFLVERPEQRVQTGVEVSFEIHRELHARDSAVETAEGVPELAEVKAHQTECALAVE
jgi:predicted Zn-dependent protease